MMEAQASGVEVEGSFADDGTTAEAHVVTITWGDGSQPAIIDLDATETSFSYPLPQYANAGPYTVQVTVADADGTNAVTQSFNVNYTNSQPSGLTVSLDNPTIATGGELTLSGSFNDPQSNLAHLVTIDWGDVVGGVEDTTTLTLGPGETTFQASPSSSSYATAGNYNISVTVTGLDGTTTTPTPTQIAVTAVSIGNIQICPTIDKGGMATLSADVDNLQGAGFSLTVNWGPNQTSDTISYPPGTTSFTLTHHYVDNASDPFVGPYPIVMTVTAGNGPAVSATKTIQGTDVPTPVYIEGGSGCIIPNQQVTLQAIVADPGEFGTYTYSWTATAVGGGDTQKGSNATFNFTPDESAAYTVTLEATDPDKETFEDAITIAGTGSGGGNGFTPDTPTVTIEETDPGQTVQAGNDAHFEILVSGNDPNHGTVNVYYTTQDGTDHAGTDYTPSDGDQELTFTWDSKANGGSGGYDPQFVSVKTDADANDGTFSVVSTCDYDQNAQTPCTTESAKAEVAAGTWRCDDNWAEDLTTLRYTGTATAVGGPASLETLAKDITGSGADWTFLRDDPANSGIIISLTNTVPANTKVSVALLLEQVEDRVREAVVKAAGEPKNASVGLGTNLTQMTASSINSVFYVGKAAPSVSVDCGGMAQLVLSEGLISVIGTAQFNYLGSYQAALGFISIRPGVSLKQTGVKGVEDGDWVEFDNKQPEYQLYHNDEPWSRENAITVGNDSYFGWCTPPNRGRPGMTQSYAGWCDTLALECNKGTNGVLQISGKQVQATAFNGVADFWDIGRVMMRVFSYNVKHPAPN